MSIAHPKHLRTYLALLLIAVAVASTQFVALTYLKHLYPTSPQTVAGPTGGGGSKTLTTNSSSEAPTNLYVSTLVNYGNTSLVWYNHTKVPVGANFYDLSSSILSITCRPDCSTLDPNFGEHYIWSINGKAQNDTFYWSLWIFCPSAHAWSWSLVGVDSVHLTNGQKLAWYYTDQNNSGSDPPVVGAKTVFSCSS